MKRTCSVNDDHWQVMRYDSLLHNARDSINGLIVPQSGAGLTYVVQYRRESDVGRGMRQRVTQFHG